MILPGAILSRLVRVSLARRGAGTPAGFVALAVVLAAGCVGYRPGSLEPRSRYGAIATVGCLDMMVESIDDPRSDGKTLAFAFGNRCDRKPVHIDVRGLAVTGHYADGRTEKLVPYDPLYQVGVGVLGARVHGQEFLEYHPLAEVAGTAPGLATKEATALASEQWAKRRAYGAAPRKYAPPLSVRGKRTATDFRLVKLCVDFASVNLDEPGDKPVERCWSMPWATATEHGYAGATSAQDSAARNGQ